MSSKAKSNHYQALVVGAGCLGLFMADHLRRAGLKNILLIERSDMASGVTALSGGMVRCFHLNPQTSELALESLSTFLNLDIDLQSDEKLFEINGALSLLPSSKRTLGLKNARHLSHLGARLETFGALTAQKKFPQIHFTKKDFIIYEALGGTAKVSAICQQLTRRLNENDIEVRCGTEMTNLWVENQRVKGVLTPDGALSADLTVLTTGLQTIPLLQQHGLALPLAPRPVQSQICRLPSPKLPNYFNYENLTFAGRCFGDTSYMAGISIKNKTLHGLRPEMHVAHRALEALKPRIPAFHAAEILHTRRSLDLYNDDNTGCNGFVSGVDGLYVLAGWGGGAFKLAPALARRATTQILSQRLSLKNLQPPILSLGVG